MTTSAKAFLWSVVVLIAVVTVSYLGIKDIEYSGTIITIKANNRDLQVNTEKDITIEAGSPNFFVLRKESGETVDGIPEKPKIGSTDDIHFYAKPRVVPGGKWILATGTPTVIITSETPIRVQAIHKDPLYLGFLILLIGLCIWLIGIILML